jgi:hypothetical protein
MVEGMISPIGCVAAVSANGPIVKKRGSADSS